MFSFECLVSNRRQALLGGIRLGGSATNVPPIVGAEKELWRSNVPMILYYVMEHHLPQRIMKQFGRKQNFPLQHELTSQELHE